MKKKNIAIFFAVIAAVLLSAWFLFPSKALGNMNHSYAEPTTSSSNISFSGETGERTGNILYV